MIGLVGWKNTTPQQSYEDVPCNIYGNIFLTNSAKNAQFVVYVESEESFADLVVFKESEASYADIPGHWLITEELVLSDYSIYITENISEADFTIAFTETESFAGCDQ